jgi:hypothetical protein
VSAFSEKVARQKRGYFRTADLDEVRELTLTIAFLAEDQSVFDEVKDVLYFEDDGRQLQLNVTNAEQLISLFGDEPSGWAGRRVTLYLTTYGKENKSCIRLKAPGAPTQAATDVSPKPTGGNGTAKETARTAQPPAPFNDEIPF